MATKRVIPAGESTGAWEQNEANVMRKLLNESAEAQRVADEKLVAELAPIEPMEAWQDWWNNNESVRKNTIARINAMVLPGHIDFLNELHKNCNTDCGYKTK